MADAGQIRRNQPGVDRTRNGANQDLGEARVKSERANHANSVQDSNLDSAVAQYLSDQSTTFQNVSQGGSNTQAQQSSFMTPAQYQRRFGNLPQQQAIAGENNTGLQQNLSQSDFSSSNMNDFAITSPDFVALMNDPNTSPAEKKLVLIAAARIMQNRNRLDESIERLSGIDTGQGTGGRTPDVDIATLAMTDAARDYQKSQEEPANWFKLRQNSLDGINRNIRS